MGIGFSTADGRRLLTYETDFQKQFRPTIRQPGIYACEFEVFSVPLAPDIYQLDLGCRSGDAHCLDYVPGSAFIEIIAGPNTPGYIVQKNAAVRLSSNWTWQNLP